MASELVELRGDVPREFVDTLDAVAGARGNGANRMTILREILAEWHRRKLHEATLVARVNRGKGTRGEAQGNQPELIG
jgi:hypothetical protein